MSAQKQALFKTEYELELETWLRRRFRAVCWAYLVMGAVAIVYRTVETVFSHSPEVDGWHRWVGLILILAAGGTQLAVVVSFLTAKHWAHATREQLLKGVSQMVGLLGVIAILRIVIMPAIGQSDVDFLLPLFFWHLIACSVLPWTPKESLRAFLPLWIGWVAVRLIFVLTGLYDWGSWVLMLALSWGLLIPGYAICAMRLQQHGRNFRTRMVGKYFMTMRQEYAKARSIHENMFPAAFDNGAVRFEYTYTPMQELGGDYIHAHVTPDGCVHLTLIDVTGHGLPAALTVNRLFGELERIHAEAEVAEPQEVIGLLNRYFHLTLAKHNIYATALCVLINPSHAKLLWSSAGHPPAYMRSVNGTVTTLGATTVLLGAVGRPEFEHAQNSIDLVPGDVILLYTDGAFEARDRAGKLFGLEAIKQLMHSQPPPRNWPQFITAAVQKYRAGASDDDVLVASLTYNGSQAKAKPMEEKMAAAT